MISEITFLFGQFVPRCRHDIAKHFDDYNVLQFCETGGVDLTIGDSRHRIESGWFWSSYPGPLIRFHAAPPHKSWAHRYLAFRGPRVKRWMSAGLFPIAPQRASAGSDYARQFDLLLELSRRSDSWGIARAALLLEMILTELADERARPPHAAPRPEWLDAVLARARRYDARMDQDHLAALAGMSPRTFRRRFAEWMGISPRDYVIRHRTARAKELLGGTDRPIKQIAAELGYQDVFFFNRQFRTITGVPPAAYRRSREG